MALIVNFIGAGNLGKTIAYLLAQQSTVTIGAICNTTKMSTLTAINFIGEGKYYPTVSELPPADITFITTPDDSIASVCDDLSNNSQLKQGSIVLHCSGSLTSDALISVKQKGCFVASSHPMRSFAKPELSIEQYRGTYCAIEGDREALNHISALFELIGSITYQIDRTKKSSYHAAGVFASNYLVCLSQQALLCMQDAGVEERMAMHIITNIMQGTVTNLGTTLSPQQSLTGPIKRGDLSTLLNHVKSFSNEQQKQLYSSLGKATLDLTQHNHEKKEAILNALQTELYD